MRKAMILILVFIIPISVVAAIILIGEQGTPAWQKKLNEYTTYQNINNSTVITTRSASHASKPWNFEAKMSGSPWGDNVVFTTAAGNYDETKALTVSLSPVLTKSMNVIGAPLPYPPDDLWCILLQVSHPQTSTFDTAKVETGSEYAVVFVGLHVDLYNGAWVIHESADPFPSPELNATLDEVGCKLELPEGKE